MKPIYIIIFIFITTNIVFAQPAETIKHSSQSKIKGFAKNSERLGDTYSAIEYYEQLQKNQPKNSAYSMALGKLYQNARNYPMAKEYYTRTYENDKDAFPEALYYKALMEKMCGDYDVAKEDFQFFLKTIKGGAAFDKNYKKFAKIEIDGCVLAKNKLNSALKVFINHVDTSINKAHVEMSPFPISNNKIIYASLKADKVKYIDLDSSQKMPVRQIYTAKKVGENWESTGIFDGPFNIPDVNTCNGSFSPDGNHFYFTRCKQNWKNKTVCEIYLSKKVEGVWSEPEKLNNEINNPKYTSTQPTVGSDSKLNEEVLYFVSDRDGGKGGLDIWYSSYNSSKNIFKTPHNAGSKINTIGDEATPFYDLDSRTMYFSSTGFPGMGGYDIFKNTGELSKWINSENVGYPLNSCTDDIYFVVGKNKEEGFFVSNRKGGVALLSETCCDDIYEYKWSEFIRIGVTGKIYAIKDSTIYKQLEHQIEVDKFINDDDPFEKIDPLNKQIVNLFLVTDEKERVFIKSDTTDIDGRYFFDIEPGEEYKVVVENYGMFNKKLKVDTRKIVKSDTIRLDAIYINILPKESIIIKNIYYDFDDWKLTETSKMVIDTTLLKILITNPRIVVEISSHTDNKGDDDYNLKLSQRRAESVVKYLISKDIDKDRLSAKGYGEKITIAKNENADGSDNPEGRQMNRRTEFKIIGSLDQYSKIIYQE